jgi:glucan 1,3-beta-glucosidase
MSSASGTQHQGVLIEDGSGGFLTDLTFNGGNIGANFGNQQFTTRNLVFNNVVTAIKQTWDWGWTYIGLGINNCGTGLDISSTNGFHSVGSVVLIDSSITNTPVGILTTQDSNPQSGTDSAPNLILENVLLNNVGTAIQGNTGVFLAGSSGTSTIVAWGSGHAYSSSGESTINGPIAPVSRPANLLAGNNYYTRSKPQYSDVPLSSIVSVRDYGAVGDGQTDDTAALINALSSAQAGGNMLFVDAGTYLVTSTVHVPAGSRVVGESYSVIMSSGSFFADMTNPQPVVRVGNAGETGVVEWSDMIVSSQGAQAGAVLVEWNLASPAGSPSGMWDVHTRVGGFAGSNLEVSRHSRGKFLTT